MKIQESQDNKEGNVNSNEEILSWIENLNQTTHVDIRETSINEDSFWFYDDYKGEVLNRKRSFFSITGLRYFLDDEFVSEQPIIIQNEIGYLGIIAKEIDGVLNFLMQAKIEPGNVNCVQISPTIQATKSNFTRAHGGKLPLYFEWFENANENGRIIYDQIQSEQGSRFKGKRNRNIIILTDKEVPLYSNYKWMTLGQIKMLMKKDNLVNMDTRTVLSGLFPILNSSSKYTCDITKPYSMLNDYKMYHDVHRTTVPLNELINWKIDNFGITNKTKADFCVRYYNIEIQGREVQKWTQPLFKATSNALFVLFTRKTPENGREFLISLCPEIGCHDKIEFGPSIQLQNKENLSENNPMHMVYLNHKQANNGILTNVILSEEGGRFFHEQNINAIIEVQPDEIEISPDMLWVNSETLGLLLLNNNVLNIQLRNLIALLDIKENVC